jgi:ubiquitin thioesterase protein OTUB1
MNKYSDKYAPYLELPVKEYCKNRIDPVNSEIENVGLSAVFDWLLSPAGIGLNVQYLDRSAGAETTTYSWEPTDHTGMPLQDAPSVTLLYRPFVIPCLHLML